MKHANLPRPENKEEMDEELRSHIAHRADDLVRYGLSRGEAERQARIEFGAYERFREECHEIARGHFFETLLQDVRYALRMLRKSPSFTTVVVLTLALGIGANTAIFSVVNAVLLRPLPFPHPEQLVALTEANQGQDDQNTGASYVNYAEWRKQNRSFGQMAGYQFHDLTLTGIGDPTVLDTVVVTPSLFPLLEVRPLAGRTFSEEDGVHGAAPVVILSERLWRTRFAREPHIVGKSINLDQRSFTVVGVMPASFRFPLGAENDDIWIPLVPDPLFGSWIDRSGGHWLRVIARLQPGVSFDQARTDMAVIATRLAKQDPAQNAGWTVHVLPLHKMVVGSVRSPLLVLLGAVGLVLLIACVNIANLLLARSTARSKEMAIRIALGAARRRITRQLLTESAMLGLLGAITGVLIAWGGVSALQSLLPPGLPPIHSIRVDASVLAFALLLSLAASVLFGLAPVCLATHSDPQKHLGEGARGGEAKGSQRTRNVLAIVEVALAMVLLVVAGLLLRSFARLTAVSPGFETTHVVKAEVSLPRFQYSTPQQWTAFSDQLLTRLQATPGLQQSAIAVPLPILDGFVNLGFSIVGAPPLPPVANQTADYVSASPRYFSVMGIPLLRGRVFDANDTASTPRVAVISEAMAKRYFPHQDPLGREMKFGFPPNGEVTRQVVGVVGDVHDVALGEKPGPMMYVPFAQEPFWGGEVVVRSNLDASAVVNALKEATHSIDRTLPVTDVAELSDALDASVAQPRFRTLLLAIFGAIALVLAAVGIFGVVAWSVSRRTREIGIRMALGATPATVRRLVMGESAKLVMMGLALGIAAAAGVTRFLASLLFAVHATDPLTYCAVALLLISVAMIAAYIPAQRAMRVNPTIALRCE